MNKHFRVFVERILLTAAFCLLLGCEQQNQEQEWRSNTAAEAPASAVVETTITIGDIDPDTPTARMQRIRPLADAMANYMGRDPSAVKIRIARSIDEISQLIMSGEVDLYVDSSYPSMLVGENADSVILLESPVNGSRTYRSLLVTQAGSQYTSLGQLDGLTVALQERYSTSGYLLPAAILAGEGYELVHVNDYRETFSPGTVGYFYTGDEENTLAMVRKQLVPAGALSSEDYDQLPDDVKNDIRVIATSDEVPRKLLSIRKDLDPALVEDIRKALLSINDEDRKQMIARKSWNWEFLPLDEQSERGLSAIREMITVTRNLP